MARRRATGRGGSAVLDADHRRIGLKGRSSSERQAPDRGNLVAKASAQPHPWRISLLGNDSPSTECGMKVTQESPSMSPLTTPAAIDRTDRGANPGLLVLLIVCLFGAIGLFYFLPGAQGAKLFIWIITVLAVLGIFSILLYTFGILQFAGQAARNDTTKVIADTNSDGLSVTDSESRIVYASEAYMTLSGAHGAADLRVVERLFS